MPLFDFIHDDAGRCLGDDVLRFEEPAAELPRYLRQMGVQIHPDMIPQVGSSGIRDYRRYYDEETRSFVEHLYQYEIDRSGYEFEDLQ